MDNYEEIKNKFELKIHFDNGENSLFDLGYVSLDVLQLIILGDMIEDDQVSRLEEMFAKKKPYGYFTRDSHLYRKYRDKTVIKELRKGSIEIVLAGVGTVGTMLAVLVPIVIEKINKDNETIVFSISSNDEYLNKMLDEYEKGYYGKGIKDFDRLIGRLASRGYDIKLRSENAYIIDKITEDYGRKIIKTIKKN